METELHVDPWRIEMTSQQVSTLVFNAASRLSDGETIVSAVVTLTELRTRNAANSLVSILGTTSTTVRVKIGPGLSPGLKYRLEVVATVSNDKKPALLLDIECVS